VLPNSVSLNLFLHGNGPWVVGSSPECDLPVKARGVSRKHLELRRDGPRLFFKDLESTNGTLLNSKPVGEGILSDGALIQIGEALIRLGDTGTDGIAVPPDPSGLRLDSYMDITWEGANIPSGEPSKKLVNFEFLFSQVEKFLSNVAPIDTAGAYATFMMDLLQCQGVRLYSYSDNKFILFSEGGKFPVERLKPGQLETILSTGRVSGFILDDKTEPLYFLAFPIQIDEEMRVVFVGVMPYFTNIMMQNQELIPSFYIQSRLLSKWSWEIHKKQSIVNDLQKKLSEAEAGVSTTPDALEPIVGRSQKLLKEMETVDRIAPTDMPVLIYGATGTGKELFARRIHKKSKRAGGPFIAINCASIPENLLESELFGAEKGAYTGADKSRSGYFEKAAGGTIFLDEIGDMPLSLQPKLLRVLEEKQLTPLGSTKTRPIDVRIVAATNQDLFAAVGKGKFRQDLFYRLTEGIPIRIPPLCERGDDILILANYFLQVANREFGKSVKGFEGHAVDALKKYSWPGNVRQLQSLVKHMVLLCHGDTVTGEITQEAISRHIVPDGSESLEYWNLPISEAKEAFEKEYLSRRLAARSGSISALARELGIARPNLYLKLKKWGLEKK